MAVSAALPFDLAKEWFLGCALIAAMAVSICPRVRPLDGPFTPETVSHIPRTGSAGLWPAPVPILTRG